MNRFLKNVFKNSGSFLQNVNKITRNSKVLDVYFPNAKPLFKISARSLQISSLKFSDELKNTEKIQKNFKFKTKRLPHVWKSSATNESNERLFLFNSYTKQKVNCFFCLF
jgi:hypothetical protein